MGGGDLNMKKSWHPQTFQNVERVWMAEQRAIAEKRKIEQLQKELAQEQAREEVQYAAVKAGLQHRSTKLEWMYQASQQSSDKEEYLLGKPVDKRVLSEKVEEDDLQLGPAAGANLRSKETVDPTERLRDMQTKVRDDPMFAMKKKQQERLRELRSNPVKMKELRRALERDDRKHKKKHKDKKKKTKKDNRHHVEEALESSSRSSIHVTRDVNLNIKSQQDTGYSSTRSHPERHHHVDKDRYNSPPSQRIYRKGHGQTSSREKEYELRRRSHNESERPNSRGVSSDRQSNTKSYRNHSLQGRSESRSPFRSRSPVASKSQKSSSSSQETEDSRDDARRLEAMRKNAAWRENIRRENLRKYEKEEELEKQQDVQRREATFLRETHAQSWRSDKTANLSDRVRRNVHYLQRTERALESGIKR